VRRTAARGALTELLRALPPAWAPGLCVQHIAASEPFAVEFSDWLARPDRAGRPCTPGAARVRTLEAGRIAARPHLLVRTACERSARPAPAHSAGHRST